jgi:hypothetical protein
MAAVRRLSDRRRCDAARAAPSCGATRAGRRWCRSATFPRDKAGRSPLPFPWRSSANALTEPAREERAELGYVLGTAGRARVYEPTAGVVLRKWSSAPHREQDCHRRPSHRRRSPVQATKCAKRRLPSPCDASLSAPRIWPGRDRGSGPAAPTGVGEPEASPGTPPLRAGAIPAAAPAGTLGTAAVLDRNDRRNEAELDTARSLRAGTPTTTTGSMPPFSGHGARAVMNVTASYDGDSRKPGVAAPGFR